MWRLLDTIAGLWYQFWMVARSGFRLRGNYWTWRFQTAFGRGLPSSKKELVLGLLEYGRWVARMRRL